jgi:hypothetical protein
MGRHARVRAPGERGVRERQGDARRRLLLAPLLRAGRGDRIFLVDRAGSGRRAIGGDRHGGQGPLQHRELHPLLRGRGDRAAALEAVPRRSPDEPARGRRRPGLLRSHRERRWRLPIHRPADRRWQRGVDQGHRHGRPVGARRPPRLCLLHHHGGPRLPVRGRDRAPPLDGRCRRDVGPVARRRSVVPVAPASGRPGAAGRALDRERRGRLRGCGPAGRLRRAAPGQPRRRGGMGLRGLATRPRGWQGLLRDGPRAPRPRSPDR